MSLRPVRSFIYRRAIRFSETDAAGVVYFANILTLCHEAYEASLAAVGVNLAVFFSPSASVVPIVHAEADFKQPLVCGDEITIYLQPRAYRDSEFEISYQVYSTAQLVPPTAALAKPAATALTRHVCIDPATRQRQTLRPIFRQWYERWSDGPPPAAG